MGIPLSRTPANCDAPLQVWRARVSSAAALVLYPLGGLIMLVTPDAPNAAYVFAKLTWGEAIGFTFIIAALLAYGSLAVTRLNTIAWSGGALDEWELALRRRAQTAAYAVFTGLTAAGLLYFSMVFDVDAEGLWRPTRFEHWNALIWFALLYSAVLPAAFAAWMVKPLDDA